MTSAVRPAVPPARPSPSYVAPIANVILSSPGKKLNLSSIYRAVEESFPQVGSRGPGWRNSVRHNLSVNDCFVKLSRCEDGRGHYWGVHHAHLAHFEQGNFKRSRRARGRRDGPSWVAPTDPCRTCWCQGHQLNFTPCIQPWWWVGGAQPLGTTQPLGGVRSRARALGWTKPSQFRGKPMDWHWKTTTAAAGGDKGHLLTPRVHSTESSSRPSKSPMTGGSVLPVSQLLVRVSSYPGGPSDLS